MIKWRQLILVCLFIGTLFLPLSFGAFEPRMSNKVVAQSVIDQATDYGEGAIDSAIPTITNELGAIVPNWANITFSSLPAITQAGSISLDSITNEVTEELIEALDYDISRIWNVGDSITSVLKLGDLADSTQVKDLALGQIADLTGLDLSAVSLEDFSLSQWQTIESLARAIPGLKDLPLDQVKPIYDLVTSFLGNDLDISNLGQTIGDLLNIQEIADLGLESLDLSQYGILSIPGLINSPLGQLNKWQDGFLQGIPGLKDLPFSSIFKGLLSGGYVALHDVTYGQAEARRLNTITGSNVEGYNVPCDQDSCSYVELSGPSSLNAEAVHGKQWIKGGKDSDAQMVNGGSRLLKVVNGGKEPTGRNPYGSAFKVVLSDTTESEGLAEFSTYFRYCKGIYGCTPYFIGPLPWFNTHEDDVVFIGLNQTAEPPSNAPANPGLPPGTELPIDTDPIPSTNDECETYKGVSMGAFEKAIAKIESLGSGGYTAIGDWVCSDKGTNCGRALGKYQFMTYNEVARNRILKKPGGANFLQRAASISALKANLSKEILTYFPPQEQEAAKEEWFKVLINKAAAEGKSGDNLVERSGAMHNAGLYSTDGSASRYGDRVLEEYKKAKPIIDAVCKQRETCTGKLANPAPGYPVNSGYGWRNHPISGDPRLHSGIDYGTPMNIPIKAADGGKVVHASWMGGYGNTVDIRHCDGRLTRYAHLNQISVTRGGAVSKGQVIGRAGTTGRSTGPHLHFEVHVKGRAVDPNTQW